MVGQEWRRGLSNVESACHMWMLAALGLHYVSGKCASCADMSKDDAFGIWQQCLCYHGSDR
jgi:hypothetical protein